MSQCPRRHLATIQLQKALPSSPREAGLSFLPLLMSLYWSSRHVIVFFAFSKDWDVISLPCQVWKSHVYREGRELHSGGEGQGACLHQGFRATILPSILFSISSKADLIHAFLSVADLQHSVLSPVSFRLEYKRGSTAPAMFQRQVTEKQRRLELIVSPQVRMQVDLSPVAGADTPAAQCLHAITFTLISGNIRRFRRICEHIQSMVRNRSVN